MGSCPSDQWESRYGWKGKNQKQTIDALFVEYSREETNREEALKRARQAREQLDDLNGAAKHTDAKDSWDDQFE